MRLSIIILTLLFSCSLSGQFYIPVFPNQNGDELLQNLVEEYKPISVLSLDAAKDIIYSEIYNLNDSVSGVYTNHTLFLPKNVDPSTYLHMDDSPHGINVEHTYPKSKGSENGNAEKDMHHLFPTRSGVNSSRKNLPFGEILDSETETWYYLNFSTSLIPSENKENYSERGGGLFEPQESHKGNVARAIMYFYTMYIQEANEKDSTFFETQRSTLCNWHQEDPVDSLEWQRTFNIAQYQSGKSNPFVLDSTLAERSYCGLSGTKRVISNIDNFKVYPNPNHGTLKVDFTLKSSSKTRITVFDITGREILFAFEKQLPIGNHIVPFDLNYSGVFILRLETDIEILNRKLVVSK